MANFRDIKTAQKFASAYTFIHNNFNKLRYLNRRGICKRNQSAAPAARRQLAAREP